MNLLQRELIEKSGHDHGFEHVVESGPSGVVLASARRGAARHATHALATAKGFLAWMKGMKGIEEKKKVALIS